jgi:hypothetical protein
MSSKTDDRKHKEPPMAIINTALLIQNATDLGHLGYRASQVQRDPAVQKSCNEAREDVVRAANSIARAAFEIRSSWYRTGLSGNVDFSGFRA